MLSKEHRNNISKTLKSKWKNKELKLNSGCFKKGDKIRLGKEHSDETKRKISLNHGGGRKKGCIFSEETKQKMSLAKKGIKPSKNAFTRESIQKRIDTRRENGSYYPSIITRKKMSLAKKGKTSYTPSEKTKEKIRIQTLKRISLLGGPALGKNETKILDKLEKVYLFKIIRQFYVAGYALDGYIKELNLAIEIDEIHHFNIDGKLKNADIIRQNNIEKKLGCLFLRIKDNYKNNYKNG